MMHFPVGSLVTPMKTSNLTIYENVKCEGRVARVKHGDVCVIVENVPLMLWQKFDGLKVVIVRQHDVVVGYVECEFVTEVTP